MAEQQVILDDTISSLRSTIFTIGGMLIAGGYLTDEQLAIWGGVVVNLATVGWLLYRNRMARKKLVSAVQVGQAMPQKVQSEAKITADLNSGQLKIPSKPIVEPVKK